MFNQQLDMFGGATDIAPTTRQVRLFTPAQTMKGQTAMATERHANGPNGETIMRTVEIRGEAFGVTDSGVLAVWRHTSWWLASVATPRGFSLDEIRAKFDA